MLNITIMSTARIVFKGAVESAVFPGDSGVFEVMAFHKRMMSRLLKGNIEVDGKLYPIARGIVKVDKNEILAVIEEEAA